MNRKKTLVGISCVRDTSGYCLKFPSVLWTHQPSRQTGKNWFCMWVGPALTCHMWEV